MNILDQLIDLYEELDSPHEPIRKQVQIKYDTLYAEIQDNLSTLDEIKQLSSTHSVEGMNEKLVELLSKHEGKQ